jgi:hypothetical protein
VAGGFGGGSLALDYSHSGEKLSVTGTSAIDLRRYVSVKDTSGDYFCNFSATVALGPHTRLSVAASSEYSSVSRFSSVPGLGLVPANDVMGAIAFSDQRRFASATNVGLRRALNSRSGVYVRGNYVYSDTAGIDFDRQAWGAGGGYDRQVTQRFRLNLGYDYEETSFGTGAGMRRTVANNVNLGFNYVRPLSFSRRTTVGTSSIPLSPRSRAC